MAWFRKQRPLVSICIPAYDAQAFIASTLDSALMQTVEDIEIVVSNDDGIPTPALDRYRDHDKVRVIDQPKRLGWVQNTNFVLSKARGQYFMVLPHDDVLSPTYVEECLACLEENPQAFAAYSDIEHAGGIMEASEVLGELEDRTRHVMENLYNGYCYRALMRRQRSNWPMLKMRYNPPTDYCVDTTWILQQALLGELRRVPKPLYFKNSNNRNTHTAWEKIPKDELIEAWDAHCETLGSLARMRLHDDPLVDALIEHRKDPNQVRETPSYLRAAFQEAMAV
ncbi:Glycosyl transferase family 2 [Cohaesibacter sp. ES.047]|uniref:glycosyltransferase family 2 protein n=1 Tax=Cohaesibacter sp. ES.047 TaxID=1798205 RepID=UPI000BB9688D|nr:glycosyltransferase family A protein [Cohaesibacter sp. ES.047]SNY93170.1 Glycosyl transferase family 2 [Cohaesibacter sp. ES.047]